MSLPSSKDEEETRDEAPVAFSQKVLRRAVALLEARYARRRTAEAAFLEGASELKTLPLASPERAECCRLLARLRDDEERTDEALALLARAAELYEEIGEPRQATLCRLEQGWLLLAELETEAARPQFEEAAGGLAAAGDFALWLDARCGLAHVWADLGLGKRASAILREVEREAAGRPLRDWLHGRPRRWGPWALDVQPEPGPSP